MTTDPTGQVEYKLSFWGGAMAKFRKGKLVFIDHHPDPPEKPMPKLVVCPRCEGSGILESPTRRYYCSKCWGYLYTRESVLALIAWRKEQSDEAD